MSTAIPTIAHKRSAAFQQSREHADSLNQRFSQFHVSKFQQQNMDSSLEGSEQYVTERSTTEIKNLEGEMLPPTRASLLPHVTRANYIAMRDKSYTSNCPALPPIDQNGWFVKEGLYIPVRCLNLPAPRAVIELTKCSCKSGCTGRCTCCMNSIPCTPLCKCSAVDCDNVVKNSVIDDDVDE